MSETDPLAANAVPTRSQRRGRRYWFLVITLLPLGALIILTFLPSDEPGTLIVLRLLLTAFSLTVVGFWFFVLSRFGLRRRLSGVGALASLAVLAVLCVRRIEFMGDLVPRLEYRWSPDSQRMLAVHRREQGRPEAALRAALSALAPKIDDDPTYRGANQNGVLTGPALSPERFHDPQPMWRQPIGGGYSGFALVDPYAVTLEQRGDDEVVACYDMTTGAELWVIGQQAHFRDSLSGDGPRATPCIDAGRVFALGATGILRCLDLATGQLDWNVNVLELAEVENVDCGLSASPFVYGSKVVVHVGAQGDNDHGRALLALDARSGKVVWKSGRETAGYTSPMLVELHGLPQILILDRSGLAGHDLQTGDELWRFAWPTEATMLAAQPLVIAEGQIFISNGDDCALIQVDFRGGKWSVIERWRNIVLRCRYSSPVAFEGFLYGLDRGMLSCVDASTGRRVWKQGRFGNGQILRIGDQLLVQGEEGNIALVLANSSQYVELGQFQALEGKTWNMPALSGGVLVIRNHREMAAYRLAPTP